MRLAAPYGSRTAINRRSSQLFQTTSRVQCRPINTKSRDERPSPITEQFNLRLQPNPRAQSIGVLGGGITGLTTAWHLARYLPDAQITLYEKEDRLGGWLNSEKIEVDGGEVLFEWGPRSLRPDPAGSGRATITLLLQLNLHNHIIGVTKRSPAALNRFVYYGGHLVHMPGPNPNVPPFWNAIRNGYKVLTEPIFQGLLGSIFAEHWVQTRPSNMADESLGAFVSRRFGKTAADNLASAFFHGIYAGDLYKLSARTLLPAMWHMETRDPEGAGILMEMTDIAFKGQGLMQYKHGRYVDLLEAMADHDNNAGLPLMQHMNNDLSVYTFGDGLQTLSRRLQEKLEETSNVEIRTQADVSSLEFDRQTKKITVSVADTSPTQDHDYVVSTLSAKKLSEYAQSSAASRGAVVNGRTRKALNDTNKSVNVAVVNLYYSNPRLIPSQYRGFGYLIPRSVDLDQNPERALGVIFGSESSGVRGKDAQPDVKPHDKEEIQRMHEMLSKTDAMANEEPEESNDSRRKGLQEFHDALGRQKEFHLRRGQDTAPGTKLTVMLGGHWWDEWTEGDLPDEEQCIDMAKTILARHLKIMEAPMVAKARINRNCIPQYHVGYRQRMASVHEGLMEEFQGRLKVAGPWWQGGVGVNDCILSAHLTAFNIREEWDDETGLKDYTEKEKWLICDRRTQTFSLDTVR